MRCWQLWRVDRDKIVKEMENLLEVMGKGCCAEERERYDGDDGSLCKKMGEKR
jgi:hypothetical protein